MFANIISVNCRQNQTTQTTISTFIHYHFPFLLSPALTGRNTLTSFLTTILLQAGVKVNDNERNLNGAGVRVGVETERNKFVPKKFVATFLWRKIFIKKK